MTAYLHLPVRTEHPHGGEPLIRWEWVRADQIVGVREHFAPPTDKEAVWPYIGAAADLATGRTLILLCAINDVVAMLYRAGHALALPDHADLWDERDDWQPAELLDYLTAPEAGPPVLFADPDEEGVIEERGERSDAYDPAEEADDAGD